MSNLLQLSQRVFTQLLALYPREYRQEYGPLMAQLFKDCSREAASQGGAAALLELWVTSLLDVFKTALEAHLKEFWHMDKEKTIRTAGWALLLGTTVLLALFATASMEYFRLGAGPLGMLLLAASAWLLYSGHGHAVGNAKNALIASMIAALVSFAGTLLLWLQPEVDNGIAYSLFIFGLVVCLAGLGIFGLAVRKTLPGIGSLLTLGGLGLPLITLLSPVYQNISGTNYAGGLQAINNTLVFACFVALMLAGFLLVRTQPLAKVKR